MNAHESSPAARSCRRLSVGMAAAIAAAAGAVGIPAASANASPAHAATASGVSRLAGATRFDTAITVSQDEFPTAGSAGAVVLTRGDTYPDALAGGPLAAKVGGPLLLTPSTSLDPNVQAEIVRVLPKGGTVYILGGTAAISTGVEAAITGLGFVTKRLAGADRFATAVAIADAMGDPTTVFEATGLNYADALAGGPAAIKSGGAILLTNGSKQSPATAAYLAAHPGGTHYALGGPAIAADANAMAIGGGDRYGTAAAIAYQFFPSATTVGAATGTNFPDALAAGPDLAAKGAPLLLVPSTGPLPEGPTGIMLVLAPTVTGAVVFGGTTSVSDDVAAQLGVLAAAGSVAAAGDASAAFTGRYGVEAETITDSDSGLVVPVTDAFDGTTGAVTSYSKGEAPVTDTTATLAQLAALPHAAAALETAVNTLFAASDATNGITTTDPDALFLINAPEVFLNPVAPPTLRLAVYGALAIAPETDIASGVKDSSGRVGVDISASITGDSDADSGTIHYIFDPATGLPLEDKVTSTSGSLLSSELITSISTTNTLPTDPYNP